jgi:hypothetical protein
MKIPVSEEMNSNFDGMTLSEAREMIENMIRDFGPNARIEIDSGYSSSSLIVHYDRDETPEEIGAREELARMKREKERDGLLKKKRAIEKKLRNLDIEV